MHLFQATASNYIFNYNLKESWWFFYKGHYKYIIVPAGSGVLSLSGRIANLLAHSGMSIHEIIVINVVLFLLFYIFNNDLKESWLQDHWSVQFKHWVNVWKSLTCGSERISELIEPYGLVICYRSVLIRAQWIYLMPEDSRKLWVDSDGWRVVTFSRIVVPHHRCG